MYSVSGPALTRAIQDAVGSGRQLVLAYDRDSQGGVLRVGYYMLARGDPEPPDPPITWFGEGEVQVTPSSGPDGPAFPHRLQIEFTHPKPAERHLLIDIPLQADVHLLLRCLFRYNLQVASRYVIQAEIRGVINGSPLWTAIARYDFSHGFFHRDLIAADGSKTKHPLQVASLREGIPLAIAELQSQLPDWLARLGYPSLNPPPFNDPVVSQDMREAERRLLRLFDDPDSGSTTHSTLVAFQR
jgi:hypothetical protein